MRQPLPDRQQEAGDDVQRAVGEFRQRRELRFPSLGELGPVGFAPLRLRQIGDGNRGTLHRAEQADAALDRAVIHHQPRRRNLHRGPPGLCVDQQLGARLILRPLQRLGQGERPVALAAQDAEHLRFGAALRMRVDRLAAGDGEALGRDGLDAEIIGAGRNRALDAGAQQILEHLEQGVLQRDGQRQQPVEEGRDRRQVLAQSAVLVGQPQPGRGFEGLQRATFHLAAVDQHIELAQRRAAMDGFQIVVGAEQPLAAGLALPLGDRPKGIEPAGDRGRGTASRP